MTASAMYDLGDIESEFIMPDPVDEEDGTRLVDDEQPEPSGEFIEEHKETQRAKKYRLKTKHGLNFLLKTLAGHPATVADSAAIIQHGPGISQAVGHLCDSDDTARRIVDFITEDGIDNPYVLTAIAVLPLAFQVIRNHETGLEKGAKLAIPVGKKRRIHIPFRFRIRLGKARNTTVEPDFLVNHVFGSPVVREAFRKQGIRVAWPGAHD